ncbi:MAG: competence/damage-inducible protein A, partial [Polyangiaceae bacterium]|nr:competence/damage-inducible protein A [Polyangiaceae bacterium]
MSRNAAALVIGNELLTGKIADENTPYLARTLFSLGITLRRVVICPDEIETIAEDLNALRGSHEHVFTSGGVGPTHDDITLDAVAHAFGVELIRSVEMSDMIREHFGTRTTEEHLRMANLPRGSRLVRSGKFFWPTVVMENVFVL